MSLGSDPASALRIAVASRFSHSKSFFPKSSTTVSVEAPLEDAYKELTGLTTSALLGDGNKGLFLRQQMTYKYDYNREDNWDKAFVRYCF